MAANRPTRESSLRGDGGGGVHFLGFRVEIGEKRGARGALLSRCRTAKCALPCPHLSATDTSRPAGVCGSRSPALRGSTLSKIASATAAGKRVSGV